MRRKEPDNKEVGDVLSTKMQGSRRKVWLNAADYPIGVQWVRK